MTETYHAIERTILFQIASYVLEPSVQTDIFMERSRVRLTCLPPSPVLGRGVRCVHEVLAIWQIMLRQLYRSSSVDKLGAWKRFNESLF